MKRAALAAVEIGLRFCWLEAGRDGVSWVGRTAGISGDAHAPEGRSTRRERPAVGAEAKPGVKARLQEELEARQKALLGDGGRRRRHRTVSAPRAPGVDRRPATSVTGCWIADLAAYLAGAGLTRDRVSEVGDEWYNFVDAEYTPVGPPPPPKSIVTPFYTCRVAGS